jgi:hypothetical protein
MGGGVSTLRQLNEIHRCFWEEQRQRLISRITDPDLLDAASEAMRDEQLRGVELKRRISIYAALEDAERARARFLAAHSRKGGKAEKTDTLQTLIGDTVAQRPTITAPELLEALRRHVNCHPIQEITKEFIWFTDRHGKSKKARLTGLKDRLSRAKKNLRSR